MVRAHPSSVIAWSASCRRGAIRRRDRNRWSSFGPSRSEVKGELMSRALSEERELAGAEVLVVDSDAAVPRGIEKLVGPRGLPVTGASTQERALELVRTKVFGVVVIDLDTPTPNAGLKLVEHVRRDSPASLVIVLASRKGLAAALSPV